MVNEFCGFKNGVIGTNKMPADTTLNNMKKADLIKLLHTAQHNYESLMWFYNNAVKANMSQLNNNGWIPCSERLPQTNDAVNITWINRKPELYYEDIKDKPFTATGHYHNGKWYWFSSVCKDYLDEYGDSEFDRIDKDIEIVAWCELLAPYTEGE